MERNINDLFYEITLKYPDNTALITEYGKKISYFNGNLSKHHKIFVSEII